MSASYWQVGDFEHTPGILRGLGTKAFVSRFASSLAAEAGPQGIDVMAVHPSPVRSNFLKGTTSFDVINNFCAHVEGSHGALSAQRYAIVWLTFKDLERGWRTWARSRIL